jgi:hypothetical protein
MDNRDEILDLMNSHPKHYTKMIVNRQPLWDWILANTKITSTPSAMIYSAVYQVSNICNFGNTMNYRGLSLGFKSCGRASTFTCAKTAVSQAVSDSKAARTMEQIAIENKKRETTNIQKYRVPNTGQTEKAITAHRLLYADVKKVDDINNKIKSTKLERYGSDTYNNASKAKLTNMEKYGVDNSYNIPTVRDKAKAAHARKKQTNSYLIDGYSRFCKYLNARYNFTLLTSLEEYGGIRQKDAHVYLFQCNNCNDIISKKFYHATGINCTTCSPKIPSFVSNEEQQVFDFIRDELNIIDGIQSDKSIINPYEIDMLFPSHGIAIEYNGLYWHSELSAGKTKTYHKDKMIKINSKGYRLISLFSDEWNTKKEIVKSRLQHIFGSSNNRYFARKLSIKEIPPAECKIFLNSYHIQGNAVSSIRYGLYDNAMLVAAMTFAKGRKALNSSDEYELVRYATSASSVVGGANRLLQHFIRNHSPKHIVSYADLRWSEGKVYETIGFTKIGKALPGYWYVDNYDTRHHRYNFAKHRLVAAGADPAKTEWEIMKLMGYDRIWDCGQQKYKYVC